ncbi:MAG: hypothetical protein QM749_03410 [Aquabacterium sp.]
MVEVAFVVLREMAELLLILAAVWGCANHWGSPRAKWHALRATGLGIALGAAIVLSLPSGASSSQLNAIAAVVTGVATSWVTVSMLSSNQSLTEYVESSLPSTMVHEGSQFALMAFCAFAGFREALEVGIFLKAAVTSQDVAGVLLAACLATAILALVGRAFKAFSRKPSMLAIFRVSALVLCFLAVRLSLEGVVALTLHPEGCLHDGVRSLWSLDKREITPYAFAITLLPAFVLLKRWWTEAS